MLASHRFLVVGSESSGKSTMINNLKIQFGKTEKAITEKLTIEQTNAQRNEIRFNMNAGLMQILRAMPMLLPPCHLENSSLQWRVDWLETNTRSERNDFSSIKYLNHVKEIWHDAGVRRCLERSNEYVLLKGTEYLLNRSTTICASTYQPLFLDLLRSKSFDRESETHFQMNKMYFSMLRSWQQYSRCNKWLPMMFSNVDAIMFVVDCSGSSDNLRKSLNFFTQIWTDRALRDIPIILLLKK